MTRKTLITLPESIRRAVDEDAEKLGKPVSAIIRDALTEHYKRQGRTVENKVNWGGYRPRPKKETA